MIFEQAASLNRFVADPLPLNWKTRWKVIRNFVPLLVFAAIFMAEILGLKLWMRGEFVLSRLWPVLVLPAFLLVIIFIANEINLRGSQGANRTLNVLERGISFRADGRSVIRWSKVVGFWLEDIPSESTYSKLTLEYFSQRKTRLPRRASLVLEKRSQCPALLSELKLLQQQYNLSFRIELNTPIPPRQPPRNLVLGMSLYLAGVVFLLHGVPLVLIPLSHGSGHSDHSESSEDWSPKQKEKVAEFLAKHFSSKSELSKFMIESGAILIAMGIALISLSAIIQKPKMLQALPTLQPG